MFYLSQNIGFIGFLGLNCSIIPLFMCPQVPFISNCIWEGTPNLRLFYGSKNLGGNCCKVLMDRDEERRQLKYNLHKTQEQMKHLRIK